MNSYSSNGAWSDFNDAEDQREFALIPHKSIVKVIASIRPGGYDDANHGWVGGYATRSDKTGAIYLNVKYTIVEGQYAKRVIFGLIGLHSPKGPEWANIGRSFLRAMLNSARGIQPADVSQQAQNARRIRGFGDLDGLTFAAKVEIEKDQNNEERNVIKAVIQPDHKEYASVMGGTPIVQVAVSQTSASQTGQPGPNGFSMPAWAK